MKTIIVFRFSAMGDVAMTVPVIEQFLEHYPHYQICMVSRPKFQPIFENMERVTFFSTDLEKEYRGLKGIFSLFKILQQTFPKAIFIDLHSVLRTHCIGLFAKMCGLRYIQLKKPRTLLQKVTRQHHKQRFIIPTVFERYTACFQKIEKDFQLTHNPLKPRFHLEENVAHQNCRIGIAPFAQHQGKILPISIMTEVIKKMIEKSPTVQIFLFGGGKKEIEILNHIVVQFSEHTVHHATLNSLLAELNVMSSLDVMISMDSANMHLASLCNVRVISIWGATHPSCGFLGWEQHIKDCISVNLDCRPCSVYGNKPCFRQDYACLNDITSDEIVNKVFS